MVYFLFEDWMDGAIALDKTLGAFHIMGQPTPTIKFELNGRKGVAYSQNNKAEEAFRRAIDSKKVVWETTAIAEVERWFEKKLS